MIVANLATYPPRRGALEKTVAAIAAQVDRLNIVLNEYDAVPPELERFSNVVPCIPKADLKDTGKFYPDVRDAAYVFLVDDDLVYPPDYVATTIRHFAALSLRPRVGGYHGSLYQRPTWRHFFRSPKLLFTHGKRIADFRNKDFHFSAELKVATVVDQIASGTAILCGQDMPPFDYMRTSVKFVDVRLARWCFERGIAPVCLPRAKNWLGAINFSESIFEDFTKKNPPHVNAEIRSFAYKVRFRGKPVNAL